MNILTLSSNRSLSRGYQYYVDNLVSHINKINDTEFDAKVSNGKDKIYQVHLDIAHPRKSTCNCPYADGRMIICKHKIATYFTIFPEEARAYIEEVEAYEEESEKRYQAYLKEQEKHFQEIKNYVYHLSKQELREQLINCLISEEDLDDYYD